MVTMCIGQVPAAGGGEAPARGGGRGLPDGSHRAPKTPTENSRIFLFLMIPTGD